MYQGQQFPSRKALAEHLAPLLGRSVAALEVALRRYSDNIERVVGGLVQPSAGKAIPIVYQGRQFPNRAALARHLAPLVGKTRSTLITAAFVLHWPQPMPRRSPQLGGGLFLASASAWE